LRVEVEGEQMGTPDRSAFMATLATRGLSVLSFNAGTLRLAYNPTTDAELKKRPVEVNDLSGFALQAVNAQLDGNTPPLFPSLQTIVVS